MRVFSFFQARNFARANKILSNCATRNATQNLLAIHKTTAFATAERNLLLLIFPRYFAIFYRQYSRVLFEQLGKAARSGVTNHLRNLPHSEIGIYKQMFRLTHAPALNIRSCRQCPQDVTAGAYSLPPAFSDRLQQERLPR